MCIGFQITSEFWYSFKILSLTLKLYQIFNWINKRESKSLFWFCKMPMLPVLNVLPGGTLVGQSVLFADTGMSPIHQLLASKRRSGFPSRARAVDSFLLVPPL